MLKNQLWFAFRSLAVLFILILLSEPALSQLQGKIAEQPIGIWYMRGMTPAHMAEYFKKLSARLSIGETMMKDLESDRLAEMFPSAPEPLLGGAYYMVQGLLPTYEVMSFQQVADEADALKVLNGRKKQFGGTGMLTTLSDGCYKVSNNWSYKNPIPAGADESRYLQSQQVPANGPSRSSQKIVEEAGVRYVETSTTYETCFRFHDNMLYESNVEELFTMQLPTSETLVRAVDGTNDLGLELFFDRVPIGIKQLGWNMLNSGIGTQLQQRDEEPLELYSMRRTSADMVLPLVKSILFDVDQTEGWIRFATDEQTSIRGRLAFKARRNASLTKQLEDMASGRSRFAPILDDGAAVTLHSCVQLPQEGRQVFDAVAQFLLLHSTNVSDARLSDSLQTLATAITIMGEQNCLEGVLKIGWSEASDGVVYGGIQTGDQGRLVDAIHELLVNLPNAPQTLEQAISLTEEAGEPLIQITIPAEFAAELEKNSSLKFTHAYLLQGNDCLWFALGRENAVQMIRQCIDRCQQGGRARQTSLFTFHVDGERWLSYPQDEPSGVAGLLLWLDENANWFPPGPGPFNMGRMERPVPLIQRVRDLGGSEEFRLTVDADESGLVAYVSMGEAIGNYYLARMIAWQDAMMTRSRQQAEEAQRKLQEAQRAADEKIKAAPPK